MWPSEDRHRKRNARIHSEDPAHVIWTTASTNREGAKPKGTETHCVCPESNHACPSPKQPAPSLPRFLLQLPCPSPPAQTLPNHVVLLHTIASSHARTMGWKMWARREYTCETGAQGWPVPPLSLGRICCWWSWFLRSVCASWLGFGGDGRRLVGAAGGGDGPHVEEGGQCHASNRVAHQGCDDEPKMWCVIGIRSKEDLNRTTRTFEMSGIASASAYAGRVGWLAGMHHWALIGGSLC